MTKKQKAFFDYLQKLKAEEREDTRFVETALREFFKYWERYEKDGVKDSMTLAMCIGFCLGNSRGSIQISWDGAPELVNYYERYQK